MGQNISRLYLRTEKEGCEIYRHVPHGPADCEDLASDRDEFYNAAQALFTKPPKMASSLRGDTEKSERRRQFIRDWVPGVHFIPLSQVRRFEKDAAPIHTTAVAWTYQRLTNNASGAQYRSGDTRKPRKDRNSLEVRFHQESIDGIRREVLQGMSFCLRQVTTLDRLKAGIVHFHGVHLQACFQRPTWIRFRVMEEDPHSNELRDSKGFTKDFELKKWMSFDTHVQWHWEHLGREYKRFLDVYQKAQRAKKQSLARRERRDRRWHALIPRREESGDEVRARIRAQAIRPVVEFCWK